MPYPFQRRNGNAGADQIESGGESNPGGVG
jgi:hypothetical protein